jgi:hypothetical protein
VAALDKVWGTDGDYTNAKVQEAQDAYDDAAKDVDTALATRNKALKAYNKALVAENSTDNVVSGDGYDAAIGLGYNDGADWASDDMSAVKVTGNGTYTTYLDSEALGVSSANVSGVKVFVVDIKSLLDGKNVTSDNVVISDVKVAVDGNYLDFDSSKIGLGDLEGNGNQRIELYNEWGNTGDKVFKADQLAFEEAVSVTFTIDGLKALPGSTFDPTFGNEKIVSGDGYTANLMIGGSGQNAFFSWADVQGTQATVVGNGTYTVTVDKEDMITKGNTGSLADTLESDDIDVFCVDVQDLLDGKQVDATNAAFTDVKLTVDGEDVALDDTKYVTGNLEDNTKNLRIELKNKYNGDTDTKTNPPFDEFEAEKSIAVTFTIEGLKKLGESGTVTGGNVSGGNDVQNPGSGDGDDKTPGSTPGSDDQQNGGSENGGASQPAGNTSPAGITTPAGTATPSGASTPTSVYATKKLTVAKKLVVVAPGKKAKVAFKATAAKNTSGAAAVKATSASKKVATAKVKGKKVIITGAKKAVKGSNTTVTLSSEKVSGKVSAKIKVYIRNKAKKIKPAKKSISVKKGKKVKLVLKASGKIENKKKPVVDTVTVKGKIVKLASVKYAKKKIVLTLKGNKKAKNKAVTIKVGSTKVKVKATVK